jgi:outer membrane protein assembly factor BamB
MSRLFIAAPVAAVLAAAGLVTARASTSRADAGALPPDAAAFSDQWPAFNLDLSNTRATTASPIDSTDIARLKPKWRFKLSGQGAFGSFASTPIVLGETVYLQDLSSNVDALDRATGRLRWRHVFKRPSVGPNGVAYGYGKLFGATDASAFALDASDGHVLWTRKLTRNANEGIDMAPTVYDGTVLVSTIPGNAKSFYAGNGDGIVYALDAQTGKTTWRFNTISDGARLWGNPRVNSGGGLWYPPAVDTDGRVFLAVANPAPFPGTRRYPNGSSRPGPDLYTDSLVALDGSTGKLLWYRQVVSHDLRDYDLQDSPVIGTIPVGGTPTEVVFAAGKMGRVYAFAAADGKRIWQRPVGTHLHDAGPLPAKKRVLVLPGILGGVETPMAYDGRSLYVPVVNLGFRFTSTTETPATRAGFAGGTGELVSLNASTGSVRWRRRFASAVYGAATVSNDVVFTSTLKGKVYALDTRDGSTLWSAQARSGVNGFAAVDGDTLLVGAGAPGSSVKHPANELIAYSIDERRAGTGAADGRAGAGGHWRFQ